MTGGSQHINQRVNRMMNNKKLFLSILLIVLMTVFTVQGALAQGGESVTASGGGHPASVYQYGDAQGLQQMEMVVNRFQAKHGELYGAMNEISVSRNSLNQTMIQSRERVKFLGFAVDATTDYRVADDGVIIGQNRNLWRWMQSKGWTA